MADLTDNWSNFPNFPVSAETRSKEPSTISAIELKSLRGTPKNTPNKFGVKFYTF